MQPHILVLAFGNPGRQDDGLGPRCAELLRQRLVRQGSALPVTIETNYQLTVEDALLVKEADIVIFVDAIKSPQNSFLLTPIEPRQEPVWNTHLLSPQNLLYLTDTLFNHAPEAFILAIKGYEFDQFQELLSRKAEKNMRNACQFILEKIEQWSEQGEFSR